MPKVSVVMPVYNAEPYVQEAIDSMLSQTFTDIEFIIVDDGSTDSSGEIIAKASEKDDRIILHQMAQNGGIVSSLNKGIDLSSAPVIARMDADDISLPDRLALQIAYLETLDADAVGANYIKFQGKKSKTTKLPTKPDDVARELLYTCCLGHPVVTFTREAFDSVGRYDPHYAKGGAEDYDLWLRMSRAHRLANLEQPLLRYRRHNSSISATASKMDKFALNSACAIASHFAYFYELQDVSPDSDLDDIARVLTTALDRCNDPWQRKCLKHWIIRFTRYCVTEPALVSEIKRALHPHASVKEKVKWALYRFV